MPKKLGIRKQLDEMAVTMVGDGRKPNCFFVSDKRGVFLATTKFENAYQAWKGLPDAEESALEDRRVGVIASTEPRDDSPGSPLVTYDDARWLFTPNGALKRMKTFKLRENHGQVCTV
ncbi:MAG: hypothetical protein JRN68_03230 [Nitrososphaerota archaeon]|nr:hypothetical protein [Nitrososphaerota archaeon]